MKKDHVVLDFINYPVARKIETGRSVESKMTRSTYFPNPDVPIAEIEQ